MDELQKLNKLKTLLTEIAEQNGLEIQSFLVDPVTKTVKSMFQIKVDAVTSAEEKEQKTFDSKFENIVKGFKI